MPSYANKKETKLFIARFKRDSYILVVSVQFYYFKLSHLVVLLHHDRRLYKIISLIAD